MGWLIDWRIVYTPLERSQTFAKTKVSKIFSIFFSPFFLDLLHTTRVMILVFDLILNPKKQKTKS